jgi:CubicO group peptidase (beta-lactamase class C family)
VLNTGFLAAGLLRDTLSQRQFLAAAGLLHPAVPMPEGFRSALASIETSAALNHYLELLVKRQQFSGAVLIARNGHVLLDRGYGMANWELHTPNTPLTRFYLGSLTKAFTAMAILLLQQQGKLRVSDPLCLYLPHCPAQWKQISIHEVLTHTSGIPQMDDAQLSSASPAAWLASFSHVPLQFASAGAFQYCNVCYQILGYVVQHVSGMPYTRFVQQMILRPLHMNASGFAAQMTSTPGGNALGYATWEVKAVPPVIRAGPQWSFLAGSGMLYSNVEDLYRWDQALYTGKLIEPQLLEQIFTPYVTANLFPGSQYGYGWFISRSPAQDHQVYWHDGVLDGFRTYLGRYVEDHLTILFLGNLATIDPLALAHSLERLLFGNASSN